MNETEFLRYIVILSLLVVRHYSHSMIALVYCMHPFEIVKNLLLVLLPVVVSPNISSLCEKSASSCPAALATAAAPAPSRELSVGGGA